MRERIKNKQITKEIRGQLPAVPIALIMQEVMKNFQDA